MSGPAFSDLRRFDRTVTTTAAAGATHTLEFGCNDVTLDVNVTFTFPTPPTGSATWAFTLIVRQDGSGTNTVTWPASVDWDAGTAPTLTTTASTVSVLEFFTVDGGTVWFGYLAGDAMA